MAGTVRRTSAPKGINPHALAALKNNAGDLDWLNSAASNPLMNKSNDHYDEYMAYLNRLKAIAEQKEQWEQQQQQLVDKTIGSTADSLAQSWIEAFEKRARKPRGTLQRISRMSCARLL